MNSDGDDDALSWDGDDALEARRPEARRREPAPALKPAVPASADSAADVVADAEADAGDEPGGVGTVTLLLLGILGGIYLLFTIGWLIGGVRMQAPVMFTLPAVLYQGALWLAVLAPALWFAAVLVATRGSKDWVRIVWLIAGAALLVPWPFVAGGAA
ncbi:hypothetical protein [uncultured Microbacterium sp.]|uniref:hypothetical protein n=1 Tax=uncultured Microbacterium sp. TaxID=191216 RepID=UPI00262851DB|nr:hypothetical protein [uncultured Microbacterium sp.]